MPHALPNVTPEWLASKLAGGKRGDKKALAESMGLNSKQLSDIFGGRRQIGAMEAIGALDHFGFEISNREQSGFSEAEAEPFQPARGSDADLIVSLASKHLRHPMTYLILSGAPEFDLCARDLLVIDAGNPPSVGDLVICNFSDPLGNASVQVRRWVDPWLAIGSQMTHADSEDPAVGILGVVRGAMRGEWITQIAPNPNRT